MSACTHEAVQLALGDSKRFGYGLSLYRAHGSKHGVKEALAPPPFFKDTVVTIPTSWVDTQTQELSATGRAWCTGMAPFCNVNKLKYCSTVDTGMANKLGLPISLHPLELGSGCDMP